MPSNSSMFQGKLLEPMPGSKLVSSPSLFRGKMGVLLTRMQKYNSQCLQETLKINTM